MSWRSKGRICATVDKILPAFSAWPKPLRLQIQNLFQNIYLERFFQ
jgi:hypothetical protein